MKHRNHMIPCAIIAVIAAVALATSNRTPLGAGIGLALLLCPLLMGTVMWMLMRQSAGPSRSDGHAPPEEREQGQPTSAIPQR